DHHVAAALLEIDDDVEAIHEDGLLQDREHLVGRDGDGGHRSFLGSDRAVGRDRTERQARGRRQRRAAARAISRSWRARRARAAPRWGAGSGARRWRGRKPWGLYRKNWRVEFCSKLRAGATRETTAQFAGPSLVSVGHEPRAARAAGAAGPRRRT